MIQAIALLLAFQLGGETLRAALHLPIPGPVIGMTLLLTWLVLKGGPDDALRNTSGTLLQHLSLMFVPAGTGVMLHAGRLMDEAWKKFRDEQLQWFSVAENRFDNFMQAARSASAKAKK